MSAPVVTGRAAPRFEEIAPPSEEKERVAAIRYFAHQFSRSVTGAAQDGLYESGMSDAWLQSGATAALTAEQMTRALSYVWGAADVARLACAYMSPEWILRDLVAKAASVLISRLDEPSPMPVEFFVGICETWTREMRAEIARL